MCKLSKTRIRDPAFESKKKRLDAAEERFVDLRNSLLDMDITMTFTNEMKVVANLKFMKNWDEYISIRLPIMIGRSRKRELQIIKDRLRNRIRSWKGKLLSVAVQARCDSLIWNNDSMGNYSCRSSYFQARRVLGREDCPVENRSAIWKLLWGANIYPKVQYFMWRVVHALLPVKCPWMEDYFQQWGAVDEFWLHMVSKAASLGSVERVFLSLWAIWMSTVRGSDVHAIRWKPPPSGVLKVNTDAAFDRARVGTGLAAVLRDSEGRVLSTVVDCNLFVKDVLYAGVFAIRLGVNMARADGISRCIILSDCLMAIFAINRLTKCNWEGDCLIEEIWELANFFESITFVHVKREANYCAHTVAKFAALNVATYVLYGSLPPDVCNPDL
ncbi:hypothetical protein CCACVL1_03816 [Corchorus capsularis]|uniref:RNase H type-1 domain-containing protein n=1 Tax=Corchorus capsularis TaxID=210143 RepID=A0A1R3JX53_COCAP|nr:hypothetical protein CCACVL1_03816 [Corchorus capsularis]